jgi:signal transduction histidine kinase
LKLSLTKFDMGALIANTAKRWEPQAEAQKIKLHCSVPENLPHITADQLRLTQVLGNMIANALLHTPLGGEIEIRVVETDSAPTHAAAHGPYLVTTVRDTGEGIPPEDLPHIFERFYRADRSRSRRTGGRGLGLAIVQQIVERHGGVVWVESILGAGTTIRFALPLDQ